MMFGLSVNGLCPFVEEPQRMEFLSEYPDAVVLLTAKHYMDDYLIAVVERKTKPRRLLNGNQGQWNRSDFHW